MRPRRVIDQVRQRVLPTPGTPRLHPL